MTWRTVVVTKRGKLELRTNRLVLREEQNKRREIYLGDIAVIIIEHTGVSITAALLVECAKRKIKVIFCDEKRDPISELVSLYGSHDTSARIRRQIAWAEDIKNKVWTEIVKHKIMNQRDLLKSYGKEEAQLLEGYLKEILPGDSTNREGHGAKVYWNALFGMEFSRKKEGVVNAALNYGYSIFLSAINREIVSHGYLTQLGIHHHSVFNPFNLSSDLIEPWRRLVDAHVLESGFKKFQQEEKYSMINLLNEKIYFDGNQQVVLFALKSYCQNVFEALEQRDLENLKFPDYEL